MRTPKLPRRLRLVARLGLQVALVLGLAAFLFYRGLASRAQGRTLAEVQPSQVGVLIDHRSGDVELLRWIHSFLLARYLEHPLCARDRNDPSFAPFYKPLPNWYAGAESVHGDTVAAGRQSEE